MTDPIVFVIAATKMITNQLADNELIAINLAAQLGTNPTKVMGYDKAAPLFTEQNGTKMHYEGLRALTIVVNERMGWS